ncbi:iron complex transport system permease protein [Breznakibacter xylanolyticus]|uniref:Iron complex transport system permease protein n=1 Tax=Breznakibacter xylanolyticus TaxID=990 RepID=A0A2W7QEQ6_9BACT|nr:iron ABC transporter permease [Breznakibacter xylanolyticus]PZX20399.1 iron complex transport system permease protein [Breznakibacter xylanolyticus]
MMIKNKRAAIVWSLFGVVITAVVGASVGASHIPAIEIIKAMWNVFSGSVDPEDASTHLILFDIRLPRLVLAFIAGAALAPVGAAMQALFRNPMADPYVMGVSSGASVGAAIAIVTGITASFGISLSAFTGAMVAISIIYLFGFNSRRFDQRTLLLTGIAMSMMFASVVSLLIAMNRNNVEGIIFWTMGGFNAASWQQVVSTGIPVSVGLLLLMIWSGRLNVLSMGNDTAYSLGIAVKLTTFLVLLVSALMIAFVVSASGVIGFVGLIIPHVSRLLLGPDNRWLVPFSALAGGWFVMMCDTLARTIAIPVELPVGCVTACIGAPYFIWMLLRKNQNT